MITVGFAPKFLRRYHALELDLRAEVKEKIELLKNPDNHKQLKVHKLQGRLSNRHSFYVNYKIRVVFCYLSKHVIVCLNVGDHDIYR